MLKKTSIVLMLVLMLCSAAVAKTDIFGGGNQFSAVVGSDSVVASWMWTPVEDFSWGFRVSGALTDAADQTAARWDTTLVGVGIEFPVIGVESLFEDLPVGGKAYLGLAVDVDIENDHKTYVPVDVGVDVEVNEHVSFRACKAVTELNGGDDTPYPDIRFGVKVVW